MMSSSQTFPKYLSMVSTWAAGWRAGARAGGACEAHRGSRHGEGLGEGGAGAASHQAVDELEDGELVLVAVDADEEEEGRVPPVDDLEGTRASRREGGSRRVRGQTVASQKRAPGVRCSAQCAGHVSRKRIY